MPGAPVSEDEMVRPYVRKTKQGQWTQENMKIATEKVLTKQVTIRKAAEIYNNRGGQQTMDRKTEMKLANRLTYLAGRGFGISQKAVRKYAFEFVERQFKQAWNQAATVGNAIKAFEKTGIFPLNAYALPDQKFIGDTLDQDGNTPESNNEQPLDGTLPSVDDTQSPTCSKQLTNERSDSIDVRHAVKEIVPPPVKGPTVSKKLRKLTKPILHLTSPQSGRGAGPKARVHIDLYQQPRRGILMGRRGTSASALIMSHQDILIPVTECSKL
ncbi:hypothetical protein ILUMI_21990 [Ignelater luminosus]|uniref:Uncharacterized protein n=1 Tax=Ignelater luminosus TaxID=2038154 RepID=A0A8K0CGL8_IGNLU|nr:hypothetical protein ILUMI_21990 [Ignelater luminosus]